MIRPLFAGKSRVSKAHRMHAQGWKMNFLRGDSKHVRTCVCAHQAGGWILLPPSFTFLVKALDVLSKPKSLFSPSYLLHTNTLSFLYLTVREHWTRRGFQQQQPIVHLVHTKCPEPTSSPLVFNISIFLSGSIVPEKSGVFRGLLRVGFGKR